MSNRGSIYILQEDSLGEQSKDPRSDDKSEGIYLKFTNKYWGEGIYDCVFRILRKEYDATELDTDDLNQLMLQDMVDLTYFKAISERNLRSHVEYDEQALIVNPQARTITNPDSNKWISWDTSRQLSPEQIQQRLE